MDINGGSPAENSIRASLRGDEKLLWLGGPDPSRLLNSKDIFLIPFSILWGGFAIFWLSMSVSGGAPVFFWLFGVPFVVLGLYFMVGRFIVKARSRRTTRYAVTDQRAIVARDSGALHDVSLSHQPLSTRRVGKKGHGEAQFSNGAGGPMAIWDNTGMDAIFPSNSGVAFYDVADPEPMQSALDQARGGR